MKMTAAEFRRWDHKSITLLGMSGIGKTHLSVKLRRHDWFHYSADYRIGTRYLSEPILDNIKRQAMRVPFLRELLRSDAIYIENNITVDNLIAVQTFLGKLGDPDRGGLLLDEFRRRQELYRAGEIASMIDVTDFIEKAREIYGYRHFVNDSSGSLCEVGSPEVMECLSRDSIIIYLEADSELENELNERARQNPKPMYYPPDFLEQKLGEYLQSRGLDSVQQIEPDEFVVWSFAKLYRDRIPRYQELANQYGYTANAREMVEIDSEEEFIDRIADLLQRHE